MFKNIVLSTLLLAGLGLAAVPSVSLPLDWTSAAGITRSNLNLNPIALRDAHNVVVDSLNPLLALISGFSTSLSLASNQDMILKVDADANGTNRFVITANNIDTLFRITESDSAAKFTGPLTVAGTSTFTGATTHSALTASLPVFTNGSKALASNAMTGTGSVMMSASPTTTGTLTGAAANFSGAVSTGALSATTASLSSSLTFAAGQDIAIADNSASALTVTQSSNQYLRFVTTDAAEKVTVYKPLEALSTLGVTGATTLSAALSMPYSSASITVGNGAGSPYLLLAGAVGGSVDLQFNKGTTAGTGARWLMRANGDAESGSNAGSAWALNARADDGSSIDFPITITRAASGPIALVRPVSMSSTLGVTGVATFTAAPAFSSVTASQALEVDGSKGLISVAKTGSGSDVYGTSPTITMPTVATSLTASYATASTAAEFDGSKNLVSVTKTGTGNDMYSASPTTTGTLTADAITASGITTATGGLTLGARFIDKTTSVSSNTTLGTSHSVVFANATSGAITLTLPPVSGNIGLTYSVFKDDASTNTVTIDGNASETIDGNLTLVLGGNYGMSSAVIVCTGSAWRIRLIYDVGSFTATHTGYASPPTNTAVFVRNGDAVQLNIPAVPSTASNATTYTITGLPTFLYPTTAQTIPTSGIQNNGSVYPGLLGVQTSGVIDVYFISALGTAANNVYTNSGNKGLYFRACGSYTLDDVP